MEVESSLNRIRAKLNNVRKSKQHEHVSCDGPISEKTTMFNKLIYCTAVPRGSHVPEISDRVGKTLVTEATKRPRITLKGVEISTYYIRKAV